VATPVESLTIEPIPPRGVSARGLRTSVTLHAIPVALLLLVPAQAIVPRSPSPRKELDVVFHKPQPVEVARQLALPPSQDLRGTRPLPGIERPAPKTPAPFQPGPEGVGKPELPEGPGEGAPVVQVTPRERVGNTGILAFKDKLASLAQDKPAPRLGNDARYSTADDVGRSSSASTLTANARGGSGGINVAGLSRTVGGGGGGAGGGGGGDGDGMPGVAVGKATSSIAGIGGGERPLARKGAAAGRTDEEIQIVFDRYKASFYRLYNRELRNDPSLKGQMVLKLTIEPDGSVSMCVLQSSDMNAPDLSHQVVDRVRTINFGAKEGVAALTIVYPIDFLPAA
jgi:hypothetical protein